MKLMHWRRAIILAALFGLSPMAKGQTAPHYIWPPTNMVVAIGANANFKPSVAGTTPIYYQWLFSGNAIAGATNMTMVVSNVQVVNTMGSYSLVASNTAGTLTTSNLNLYLLGVYAWGAGTNGTQGLGNNGQSVVPTNLIGVTAISGGGDHSLALTANGLVTGWGNNSFGQTYPTNGIAIAAGYQHSLALRSNGTVAAWGYSSYGQTVVPTSATNVSVIAAGWYHNLALRTNGTVVAWGAGTTYQGGAPNLGQSMVPTNLTGVAAIAAGGYHSMALLTNGTVAAWGWNAFGQTNVPAGLNNVVAIAAGGSNSMALLANGTVVAWGASVQTNVPAGLTNVVAIAAGAGHDMALRNDGSLVVWGVNSYGQTNVPVSATNVTAISAGVYHSLALVNTGPVTFMAQPWGQTVWNGSNAVFTANCLGYGSLAYQWMENGTNVTGATNNSMVYSNAQLGAGVSFQVVVSNSFGVTTSAVASLTVNSTAPSITQQPANVNVLVNSNFLLSASAGGLPPFSYQWYFNGAPILSATNAVLAVTNAQVVNRGWYALLVSNSISTVMSSNAYVNVIDLPEALGLTNVTWLNLGPPYWYPETTNTHDGFAAAGCGVAEGQQAELQTYITGPGILTFWYYASQPTDFSFAVDDNQFTTFNNSRAWIQYSCYLPAQVHQLTWTAFINGYTTTTNFFSLGDVTFTPGNTPATITSQPASQTVGAGSSAPFSATVVGTPPFAYQWYSNGVPISGWTGPSITLNDVQSGAAGNYWVVVSGPSNVVTSSNAVLTVTPSAPVISAQPVGGAVLQGNAITLTGGATGTEPLYYQWFFNNAPIPGAVGTSFTITNMGPANAGMYALMASNSVATAMSSNAVLTIYSPGDLGVAVDSPGLNWTTTNVPWFPETNTTEDGVSAAQSGAISGSQSSVLQTTVTGPAMVVYWWQVNCDSFWDSLAFSVNGTVQSSITGTVNWEQMTNYIGSGPQVLQWQLYPVHNAFAGGTGWLDEVQVIPMAGTAPTITSQTGDQTANAGNNATFSASASGTATLYYQWLFDGVAIAGATNASLALNNVQATNGGTYSVTVTNAYGVANGTNAMLTVSNTAPVITSQPASQTNVLNVNAIFVVNAKGSSPLNYQWSYNGQPISGAVGSSLTVSNLQFANAGNYFVTVSNSYGQVTSSVAWLAVTPSKIIEYWSYGQKAVTPANPGNVTAIAAGGLHALALRDDGTVLAWGNNGYGQTNVPPGLSNVVAIAAGTGHSLALQSNGIVVAWGEFGYGQGGVPPGLSNVTAIAAGPDYNLALKNDGTVTGWGDDLYGQTDVPEGLTNAQSIFAGYYGAYAICIDGSLVQWGNDLIWQRNGTNTTLQIGGSNLVGAASASYTGWSLDNQGVARAWGVFDGVGPSGNSYPGGSSSYGAGHTRYTYYGTLAMAVSSDGSAPDDCVLFLDGDGTITEISAETGLNPFSFLGPYIAQSPSNVTAISVCTRHAVALINNGSPYINWQPAGRVAYTGDTVRFTVGVSGVWPMSFQWLYNGASVGGATNDELVLTNVALSAAGSYACVITNNSGAVTSQSASLTVLRSTPRFNAAATYSTGGFGWELDQLSGHGNIIIQSSTDLVNWVPIFTNPPLVGTLQFTDPSATNQSAQFYRAIEQ